MMRKSTFVIAAALSLLLGACSRSSDEPTPIALDNGSDAAPPSTQARSDAVQEPPRERSRPVPSDGNMTAVEPPAIAEGPDEQMLDDASASGMTARTTRGQTSVNEVDPTEQPMEE